MIGTMITEGSSDIADTDTLTEGSTNLYHTSARADARIAAASITDMSDADQSVQTTDNVAFANISPTGTVDGRDVAADGTKLDTIETSATADQSDAEIRAAVEAATDSNVFTDADHTKLDGIETAATADQTKADIEGLGIELPAANLTGTVAAARLSTAATQAESDDSTKIATTAYVAAKITTLIGGAPSTLNDLNELAAAINDDANYNTTLTTALATKMPLAGGAFSGAVTTNSTFDGRDVATDGTKLDTIETSATADQTDAQIRARVEAATDSNVFTDADHTKLDGIETSATADQSDAQIRARVAAATDSNVFTDADHTKLNGIEAGATADQAIAATLIVYNSGGTALKTINGIG